MDWRFFILDGKGKQRNGFTKARIEIPLFSGLGTVGRLLFKVTDNQ